MDTAIRNINDVIVRRPRLIGLKLQCNHFEGFSQKYFIVEKKSGLAKTNIKLPKDDQDNLAQLLVSFFKGRKEDAKELAVKEKELEKSDNTGWWNLTQWHNYFA